MSSSDACRHQSLIVTLDENIFSPRVAFIVNEHSIN